MATLYAIIVVMLSDGYVDTKVFEAYEVDSYVKCLSIYAPALESQLMETMDNIVDVHVGCVILKKWSEKGVGL